MNRTTEATALTMVRLIVVLAMLVSAGCALAPAEPTPVDPNRPQPTLMVSGGTVATEISNRGTHYNYQVCYSIANPSNGARIILSEFDFTPMDSNGTIYPKSGISTGRHIEAGATQSECTVFQEFFATHPVATRYRLRLAYTMFDNPSNLSVEGTSTLTPVPFR